MFSLQKEWLQDLRGNLGPRALRAGSEKLECGRMDPPYLLTRDIEAEARTLRSFNGNCSSACHMYDAIALAPQQRKGDVRAETAPKELRCRRSTTRSGPRTCAGGSAGRIPQPQPDRSIRSHIDY